MKRFGKKRKKPKPSPPKHRLLPKKPPKNQRSLKTTRHFPTAIPEYTQELPYLAITTYTGCDVVAAGNGTITAVSSDDIYPQIIEIDHGNGYRTRYLSKQTAEVKVEQGAAVEMGAVLFTITTDETELNYQVIYQEEPIDPLSVIDARG